MIRLSSAIVLGRCADPLDAAWSVVQHDMDYYAHLPDQQCRQRIRELHRSFPHLGASVRQWPTVAEFAEQEGFISRVRQWQNAYRREIHQSLWEFITDMHDAKHSHERIAQVLDKAGL